MDFESVNMVVVLGVIVAVSLIAGGSMGGLIVLMRVQGNRDLLRAAERGYEQSPETTRMLIDTISTVLELAATLAVSVVPASDVTSAIKSASNILGEISDGVPVDSKPSPAEG